MKRKTKPIYLLIAGILLLVVAIIFVFLLTQAYNTNTNNNTATVEEVPIQHPNVQHYESTKDNASPTEEVDDNNTVAVDNVIRAKGLCVDKNGNVYDSKNNKYTVVDSHIAIVYEGNLYKISVKHIKEVNPKIKKETTEEKKPKATEKVEEVKQNTSNRNEVNTNNSNTNSTSSDSSRPHSSGNISVNQSQNVTVEPNDNSTEQNSVKMNCISLTVNNGDTFNLKLLNAGNSVIWGANTEFIEPIQAIGNQCSFQALKDGTAQVKARYLGEIYYCTITII